MVHKKCVDNLFGMRIGDLSPVWHTWEISIVLLNPMVVVVVLMYRVVHNCGRDNIVVVDYIIGEMVIAKFFSGGILLMVERFLGHVLVVE
jgi:hypothetical protein